ncbi:UV damage repair protein UvrX [Solibacillus sp. R5-41]|uniref:Y-family DNA polymerase n=1 Tax=Solibacillus sp. R5-41 TaxID=2048654 RepID=UPI000C127201|nr:UV damage repair protein UvrX [Solibacillus sp. R5-41]ATP39506.1 UV damage repair protein UvrX [Solibacillus sp. R5-41]
MMDSPLPNRSIICIDMQCFYASCIAMLEGLDVMKVPIAVIGNFQQPGSVVLAASPPMKERFRIKTGNRRYEIPNHPDIRLFEPKMSFFLDMSMAITKLIAQFVPREAIHVYSVDESFIDLTGSETLWGSPEKMAKAIQQAIFQQFHIRSAIGLGPNMLMAKLALDLEAKKAGFVKWTYEDVPKKLWPVRPLSKMWGIGHRMEVNLNNMGIFTVGGLANMNLEALEQRFGVMGNQLYYHAHGIDYSTFGEPIVSGQISFGKGQMLMRDYATRAEICVVLLEMCEDVARRTRTAGYVGRTISLGLSYSKAAMTKGFYRSKTITEPTNETLAIYKTCKELLDTHFAGEPARQLSVRISNVEQERSIQLDLFDTGKEQRLLLGHTVDSIRERFGATSVLRAVSFTKPGTAISRERLIGGHLA